MTESKPSRADWVPYELEFPIKVSKRIVCQAITKKTNLWWPPDFHMVDPHSTNNLCLSVEDPPTGCVL